MSRERRLDDARPDRPALVPPSPRAPAIPADPARFAADLEEAAALARRQRRRLSLLLVEVDVPDDRALREVISAIHRSIRATDGVWRPAEGRFAVIFADASGPECETMFARVARAILASGASSVRVGRAAAGPGIGPEELRFVAEGDLRVVASPTS